MRSPFLLLFCFFTVVVKSQSLTYDDLVFEEDSTTKAYKPSGKNFVVIKSKRGSGSQARTSTGDSIKSFEITDIVLVFSELNNGDLANRESYNRERWENLLSAYPEFFEKYPNYKNLCQCNYAGDAEALKDAQGFYIYFNAPEPPKKAEPAVQAKVVEEKKSAPAEKAEPAKSNTSGKEESVVKEEKPKKEVKEETESNVSKAEEKPVVKETTIETKKDEVVSDVNESSSASAVVEPKPVKKAGPIKPRRAKDPKACRPACYQNGEDDLNTFFKEQIVLTKKQKKKAKNATSIISLQLNVDGSIKKSQVSGGEEVLNQLVTGAVKNMNNWNPAVKGGVTVKSQVKLTLKYDKKTKSMKVAEMAVTPRPGPKCECKSDTEIFGD